ncbi:peptidylprolyl isomerase [Bradyrhizobium sp.]|uniref:peptidylprolyl isomerase n=1 Tax=Bradyrhizobium sp. TaxID=376 RepID=UPI0025BC8F61|nr:peptidylprolyl isomerase [Bradyrhizobium sp.]MCA3254138.1 peptidylprolyl isomerase [Alphaproteobacteria bacterium]MCA3567531.1 peptidylprolyl isomerase [Bradyrhizobium sp.]
MNLRRRAPMLAALAVMATVPVFAQDADQRVPNEAELTIMGRPIDPTVRKATAIVNGEIITDTDIEQRLNLVVAANGGRIDPQERERLRLQVLRNLIDEKLQIQEASEHEVKVEQAEIDQAFARVAANFRQTPAQFTDYLRRNGASANTLKGQIKGELAWSRLLRRRVEPFVNVGDDEVNTILDKLEASKGKEQVRVGEIFLSATPETEAQVAADAARIVEQIRRGASFVAYARQFSEASTAAVGGDLGYVLPEQLSAPVQAQILGMQKGQVSDPIRVPGGVAIIALTDRRKVLAADPDDALLSLKQLSLAFKPGTSEKAAGDLVKTFQDKTQAMGGCGRAEDVGREIGADVVANDQVRIKDLPGPLQAMMRNMQIGQATPPFGSQREGVRVLVLCGRDDAPTQAQGPSFDQVYAQLEEERVNRAARRYLRDLRADAIVDYR